MVAVTDDFERSSVGGNYSNGHGAYTVMEIINSSDLKVSTGIQTCAMARTNETFNNDQYSEGLLSALVDDPDNYAQVFVRFQADAESYVASANPQGDGTVDVFLEHYDGVITWTPIGSAVNVAGASGSGDILRLEVEGTTLRVYFRGVLRKTETDATLTGGDPGLGAATFSGSPETDVQFESAAFGDITLSISSIDDTTLLDGQTGVTITGTGFGASQGGGFVTISPTDDITDVNAVVQTVTSWGDTSIDFTAVRGTLDHTDGLFLFVEENGETSNAAGSALSFVDTTPAFTTTPFVSSTTETVYTLDAAADFDSVSYTVMVLHDDPVPSIAQVKLGHNASDVTAIGISNPNLVGGAGDASYGVAASLSLPIFDIHIVASNSDGDSSLVSLLGELLSPAAGTQQIVVELKEITAASRTDPVRITVASHGWETGQQLRIFGITSGMTELNAAMNQVLSPDTGLLYYDATVINSNELDLDGIDGTLFGTYISGGFAVPGCSVFENASPPILDGFVAIVDTLTSGGFTVNFNPNGTLNYDSSSATDRQFVDVDCYDVLQALMLGVVTYTVNNKAPSLIGTALPESGWILNEAIDVITLDTLIEDFEGDARTYVVTLLPPGVVESNGEILGTPSLLGGGSANVRAFDTIGDFSDFALVFSVFIEEAPEIPQLETSPIGLPIFRPQIRSIDAKTLADRFNQGTPDIPDYTFPGGRKFFQ